MRIPCPACHAMFSLDAAIEDAAARAAFNRAAKLPQQIGHHLAQYLALFRPSSHGLSWARVGRLLEELLPQIEAERVTRDAVTHAVPLAAWAEALQELCSRRGQPGFKLPLKSHGYLLEVAIGCADKLGAKAEREREDEVKRQGRIRQAQQGGSPVREVDPVEEHRIYLRNRLELGWMTQAEYDVEIAKLGSQP